MNGVIISEEELDKALETGTSYREILDHVFLVIIEKALIKSHGSKNKAAAMLKLNRGTMNKVLARKKKEAE
ncbi:TPA: Fis family transcriptional regulator [Acinetobacter baumannii]|uniref:helix-turn-helix domain-containing protein n=1 Tax=Acinetobacter baumannii TaxID=470 RepID=UPI0005F8B2D7|nr:helix-turn-helix domain-containing protein [Acinetobacter baumannii]KAF0597225.1 Fis family transcriptional regulator [Acinetobacter baumannii]KJX74100.1 Fis family transcriptional regulator [Acinetobacter baumannii]MBF6757016.1 Fis family transcriptional regulator [Acinetobacter baumannii]MCO9032729.1 Fis family transcriptional regulator [Acinetobacter baumannii]MCO9036858.1 Fis family transcriptional regulator [Acinetobacter baumannii]